MEREVKVCQHCATINEKAASFCRVCGIELGKEVEEVNNGNAQNQPQQVNAPNYQQSANGGNQGNSQYANQGYNQGYATGHNPDYKPDENYGIPVNEMSLFVGEKYNTYMPKFMNMSMKNKRAGFNAVVFLLGFFLGNIASSFWFFHRRMNKIGALVLVAGIVLWGATLALSIPMVNGVVEIVKVTAEAEFNQSQGSFEFDYNDEGFNFDSSYTGDEVELTPQQEEVLVKAKDKIMLYSIFTSALGLLGLALTIVISIFADGWYLDFARERINQVKSNPNYTPSDIMYAGGTKSAVWIVTLILFIVASMVISFILMKNVFSEMFDTFLTYSRAFLIK